MRHFIALFLICFATFANASRSIELEEGNTRLLRFSQDVRSVFVASQETANAHTPSTRTVLIYGNKVGQTDIVVIGTEGNAIGHYRVSVQRKGLKSLEERLSNIYPDVDVTLSPVGEAIAVAGKAPNVQVAQEILSMVNGFAMQRITDKERYQQLSNQKSKMEERDVEGPGGQAYFPLVVNRLEIAAATQVNISIRMVEMSRSTSEELGIRWQAVHPDWMLGVSPGSEFAKPFDILNPDSAISDSSIMGIVDALASKSLVNVLAEPNLTAKSGEKAEFLVGGEFPFPNIDGDSVGIEFKKFGVALSVTPTVLAEDRISLTVTPVVSALSRQNSIMLNGVEVPGIDKRSATTTIELGDGQSFALAGLLRTSEENKVDAIPVLGELPVVGAFFRKTTTSMVERELVIIATATLVKPVDSIEEIASPLSDFRSPTRLERLLFGKLEGEDESPRLLGQYGHRY
ncbi:type II and III secretion system protein family protein [Thaumasiovibrio subtropicus]|uniref:type II and III secretion system protein family protein n=1 Tax=Thaumasiovibrio subtropicus TaxID=1891207 RepID=UPI000B34E151|nr:pilus assembly protein N-terminal domain-containing protein [Thaumasiovibrio subtropicus]